MGRPPVGKKAMTPAERQRRRRKNLKRAERSERERAAIARARYESDKAYIPYPPGVHYWERLRVTTESGAIVEIWSPKRKPLAAIHDGLDDEAVLALLDQLHGIAKKRGLGLTRVPAYPQHNGHPQPDEACTIASMARSSAMP